MKKPPTQKQTDARKRNWQILRLRGAIGVIKTTELISQVDKDVIISLLNNALMRSGIFGKEFSQLTDLIKSLPVSDVEFKLPNSRGE